MPMPIKNIAGKKFGRWTVIERDYLVSDTAAYWLCECSCGTIGTIRGSSLRQGESKSCGCLHAELSSVRQKARATGNKARERGTLEYFKCNTWNNIRKRVVNGKPDPRNAAYIRKGIELRMTKEEFYTWCDSVWDAASKMKQPSIDRLDNNGHYELSNIQILEHNDNVRKSKMELIVILP